MKTNGLFVHVSEQLARPIMWHAGRLRLGLMIECFQSIDGEAAQ
jgi:hypothetical protein